MSTQEIYEELTGVWGKDYPKYTTKVGLESSDAPGPTLVENRDQVAKKCDHPQKIRHCLRDGDECPTSDSCTELGLSYATVNTSLQIELKVIMCAT